MLDFIIYCAGLVGLIVIISMFVELEVISHNKPWQEKVTSKDLEELAKLFGNNKDAFVDYNKNGEKFFVG